MGWGEGIRTCHRSKEGKYREIVRRTEMGRERCGGRWKVLVLMGREFKVKGWIKLGTYTRERKRRIRDKIYRGEAIVGRGGGGGRHPCSPQPSNITAVHDIFHHGYTLIFHDKPPPPTFVMS